MSRRNQPLPLLSFAEGQDPPAELPTIETIHNHVYFYTDVDAPNILRLMRHLRELDHTLRNEAISRSLPIGYPPIPIWLHVCSDGGHLHASLAAADQIKQIVSPVYSIVEGWSASGATFISMACAKRYIQPNGFMLIHQLYSHHWGTYEQQKDDLRRNEMMMEKAVSFYVEHSKMDRPTMEELLKRDSWFDAEQCLERGLVDGIYGEFA